MIPLRDNIPSRSTPVVNYAVIAACALVFLTQVRNEGRDPSLIERYGMIPARVVAPDRQIDIEEIRPVASPLGVELQRISRPAAPSAVPPWLTLLTCIFLHAGWLHFLGNMWFLWIFGDNVEDRFGHVGYAVFYVACGMAAGLSHLVAVPGSTAPTIGASGAIAGVMGAYLVLYPHAKVMTLVPIVIFLQIIVLPAPFFLAIWFLIQFIQGTASVSGVESTGVAWWAHIGGFAGGAIVAFILKRTGFLNPPVIERRPGTEQVTSYRVSPGRRW